jgi:TetR/AcrR family transcriptional regulator
MEAKSRAASGKMPAAKSPDAAGVRNKPSRQRRPVRDPVRTKQRILQIAAEEFANRGYDGARVDEIVRRSKVSKNLIYHYFDSKDALFVAVLEEAYEHLHKRQSEMGLVEAEPLEGIRRLVIDSFGYWSQSKNFIGYLNSENFHKAKHIKKSRFIQSAYFPLIDNIKRLLHEGGKDGTFRTDVDPINLYISISAMAYHYFSNQHTFSVIFKKDFTAKKMLAERLKHVEDVVLGYLQYRPKK